MKTSPVYIELTKAQKAKLLPIFDAIMLQQASNGKPPMLIAQVQFDYMTEEAVAVCVVLDHETAKVLQRAVSPEHVGKMVTNKSFTENLEMARKPRRKE